LVSVYFDIGFGVQCFGVGFDIGLFWCLF